MSSTPVPVAGAQPQVLTASRFVVEIDGIGSLGFMEVSGLNTEVSVIEVREGSGTVAVRKLPGAAKFSDVVLKRGLTTDLSLWHWMRQTIDGAFSPRAVRVQLLDEQGNPAIRWDLAGAWPVKWEGPALKAEGNDVAIETLQITYEGFTVKGGG